MASAANTYMPRLTYAELEERKVRIKERLEVIQINDGALKRKPKTKKVASSASEIPFNPKSDTHWDFVMKEMMWLGADFQGERKRQVSLAKKCAASVKQFHKTKETRRLRELHQAEMKRRKLAAKVGRDLKGWWTKIEKIISYKQKLEADEERKKAMNKQLVFLVQKTERYSESLARHSETDQGDSSDSEYTSMDESSDGGSHRGKNRRRYRMTIEEALASEGIRKSKTKIIDYSRMRLEDKEFYGASTASDSGSDTSYSLERDFDDETTLQEAIHDEILERKQHDPSYPTDETFLADPEELRKLREEVEMDIEQVLARLKAEAEEEISQAVETKKEQVDVDTKSKRRVQFMETVQEKKINIDSPIKIPTNRQNVDPGEDADDDADASDVEDYDDTKDKSDEEFEVQEPEIDDETTIAQEELLPKEMSPEEEINLLKKESEMSIEELRKLYSNLDATNGGQALESEVTDTEEESATMEELAGPIGALEGEGSEEYRPKESEGIDDETTIEAEERLGRDISYEEEIDLLRVEGEVPIEMLRAMYAAMNNDMDPEPSEDDSDKASTSEDERVGSTADILVTSGDNDDDFQDYRPNEAEAIDDETTIAAEERLEREMSYEEEMSLLKNESEIPIEQLRAMYAKMNNSDQDSETEQIEEDTTNATIPEEEKSGSTADIMTSLVNNHDDVEDYRPNEDEAEALDDETTIEVEERLGREMSYEEEMSILKNESEIPIEQLRAMYANIGSGNEDVESEPAQTTSLDENRPNSSTAALLQASVDIEGEGDEYRPADLEAVDDETTIEAEEKLGRDMSYEDEIAMLKRENEMSVEELKAMYSKMNGDSQDNSRKSDFVDKMVGLDEAKTNEVKSTRSRSKRSRRPKESDDKMEIEESANRKREIDEGNSHLSKKSRQSASSQEGSDDGLAALNALEASAERARKTLATRPFLLSSWVKLRRYQQVGLNWLVSLQSRRLNGILADEMGLGKTLQTISLLSYLASYKGIWGPHLVVVPTSVIINWETELKRFCPALKVLCYYGSAKRRKELRTGWTKTNWYHIVITSYQLAVQDAFAFKRKKWYYLILDEAQNIKNFQSQRWQTLINFNTQRRLLLTGTPLQNNLMELWSLLHFLMPYIFRSRKEFSYWFSNPMNNIIEGKGGGNEDVIKRLHGIIRPFVLRRLKKDVETQMPGKFEHIVKCQLSRRQMTLYEEFLSRSSTRQALRKGGNFMGMMTVLMQLRKVCNHPDLFEPRSVITPFVVPSLSFGVPSCIYDAHNSKSALNRLSPSLLQPLWCGSSGLPSLEAALRHNQTESEQLSRLHATYDKNSLQLSDECDSESIPTELRELLDEVYELRRLAQKARIAFHDRTNRQRCQSASFVYSSQLLDAVETEVNIFQRQESVELKGRSIVLTPSKLLKIRKDESERATAMDEVINKFVFCVPRAGAPAPCLDTGYAKNPTLPSKNVEEMLHEPLEECLKPFRKAHARLSSFFPDKKLVQFDAGKLQTLAELLFKLKREGHRALIFTQMSKMLDILEGFLNIHGHTYLRLDGATGVDRRQRYMDRFNNDAKIFCFILSTRSGGMGINLTGADTVIFYDSDWNPAMDAQAQDRAHRIGQTRDVHIYRLITEHTIEENILLKAKQKKNLDIMVMDKGKFDALHKSRKENGSEKDAMKDVYTKGGLRAILGVAGDNGNNDIRTHDNSESEEKETADLSSEQMEKAMASLEDEDDVKALRGAQKEAAEELKEFDENAEIKKNSDDEDEGDTEDEPTKKPAKRQKLKKTNEEKSSKSQEGEEEKSEEIELEKEFASWQTAVGLDASAIESSLSPMERYGMNFRELIDPFYSIFAINEYRRKMEATEVEDDIDIEEIELEKATEERQAMEDGDLLATTPRPEDLIRQRNQYRRERARLRAEKKRRKLTGENWSSKIDGLTKKPFWYNADTGEAIWDKPNVLIELEAEEFALQNGWISLPIKPLVHTMQFLIPFPERQSCAGVCRQWKAASKAFKFVRHVYPVEMGALNREKSRIEFNHFCTLDEALSKALPGDTIELSDGHYWVQGDGLVIDKPLKLVGDEHNPANVVVEMSGSIKWSGKGGWIEGITFRRPKISTGEMPSSVMLEIENLGKVDIVHSVFDNDGSTGCVVKATGSGSKGHWDDVVIRNGGSDGVRMEGQINLRLKKSFIKGNKGHGLTCSKGAKFSLVASKVDNNLGFGVQCIEGSGGGIQKCAFSRNIGGVIHKQSGCIIGCSGNTALLLSPPKKNIPGFRLSMNGSNGIIQVRAPARTTTKVLNVVPSDRNENIYAKPQLAQQTS